MHPDYQPQHDATLGPGHTVLSVSRGAASTVLGGLTKLAGRFSRFLGVGAIGFIIDSSTFAILDLAGLLPAVSRALSIGLATLVVWLLNRRFTFERSGRRSAVEGSLYAAVAFTAQGLSYAVFLVLIYAVPEVPRAVSFVFGCGIGAVVGFAGHHLLTFAPALRPASVTVSQD